MTEEEHQVTESIPEGCSAIQKNLDRLEKRASRNLPKFIKEKHQALQLPLPCTHASTSEPRD